MKKNPMIRFKDVNHVGKIKTATKILFATIAIALSVGFYNTDFSKVNTSDVAAGVMVAALPVFMIKGEFKELSGAEWDTFKSEATAEELAEYFNAKNEDSRKKLNELIANKASIEDIEALKTSLLEMQNIQLKALNDALVAQGLAIKKLTSEEKASMVKDSDLRKSLLSNVEKLKGLKGDDKEFVKNSEFTIKVAGTMLESSNISGGNVPVEQRVAGLNTIASRKVRLMDLFSKGAASSNIISWVYQANKDGAAGGTAEGDSKNLIDFDLVVASQVVVKRTAYIKVSTEMIDDVDFIESEIRNELMRELLKDVELTAYSGNGTAPALNGIRTVATAFAAGTFAATVDNANAVDVITIALNQIDIANQEPATAILMHPSDVTALSLLKVSASDKRYVFADGVATINGVPIVKTTLVTAGTYLVGAFPLATLYTKGSMNIQVGLDGNDFTKNLRTILVEWRGALVTKNNDRTAFVKGTFATDIAALETA